MMAEIVVYMSPMIAMKPLIENNPDTQIPGLA